MSQIIYMLVWKSEVYVHGLQNQICLCITAPCLFNKDVRFSAKIARLQLKSNAAAWLASTTSRRVPQFTISADIVLVADPLHFQINLNFPSKAFFSPSPTSSLKFCFTPNILSILGPLFSSAVTNVDKWILRHKFVKKMFAKVWQESQSPSPLEILNHPSAVGAIYRAHAGFPPFPSV